jgi:hypothetical protein
VTIRSHETAAAVCEHCLFVVHAADRWACQYPSTKICGGRYSVGGDVMDDRHWSHVYFVPIRVQRHCRRTSEHRTGKVHKSGSLHPPSDAKEWNRVLSACETAARWPALSRMWPHSRTVPWAKSIAPKETCFAAPRAAFHATRPKAEYSQTLERSEVRFPHFILRMYPADRYFFPQYFMQMLYSLLQASRV